MKRSVAFILSVLLFLPAICVCAPASDFPFNDVSENEWYFADVKAAFEMGLINGKGSSETFKPNENMTYAEAIKLAACMHQKYTTGSVTLSNGNPWYQTYFDYCVNNGIINGSYPFDLTATRIGYIEIFASALPDQAILPTNDVPDNSIPDVPSNSEGADGVYKLYRAGILAGVDAQRNCNPTSNIKRCEVAAILSRMMDKTKRVSFSTSTMNNEQETRKEHKLPEKEQWEDYTFGEDGDKTVEQQRQEILDAMNLSKNTKTVWKEIPQYNPTEEKYSHIKAITYEGLEYKGNKTKIFAYIGFPEGASAENPVPAIVLVHGGGGHAYYNWVEMWNKRGYAAIAMDTVGCFPTTANSGSQESGDALGVWENKLPDDVAENCFTSAPAGQTYTTKYTEVDEQWTYHALSQIILAGNILRQDEKVDSQKIGITGVSWGGTLVSQVIGYDNRFSFAIPVYGTAYLSNEMHTFTWFGDDYVDALWAAERNLSNATMPILWLAYNDDSNFSIPGYCNSYIHTKELNENNVLAMLHKWGHSHGHVWNNYQSFVFADSITFGKNNIITFETQPEGREVNCRINIPEGFSEALTVNVYYINKPMSYSNYNKFGYGKAMYLDQTWFKSTKFLTVDTETGVISGTLPEKVKGYYVDIQYEVDGQNIHSSSIYVPTE